MTESQIVVQYAEGAVDYIDHNHAACQIIYICEGAVSAVIGGKRYPRIPAGHIIVVNNLVPHRISVSEQPYRRFTIDTPAPPILADGGRRFAFAHSAACVEDLSGVDTEIETLLARLYTEQQAEADFRDAFLQSLFTAFCVLIFRKCPSLFSELRSDGAAGLVWTVKQYIEENCTQELTISGLARMHFVSVYTLTHAFKRVTGYNPKQYILMCRLAAARALLHDTDASVTEVSLSSGFTDLNNFIRYFKREMGQTPGQYRRAVRARE